MGFQYTLPPLSLVYLSGDVGYGYETASGVTLSVSVASASVGAGVKLHLTPWLATTVEVSGGYYYSFLNDFSVGGGNPLISAGVAALFLPGPFHLSVGASYDYCFGLYSGIRALAGLTYDVPAVTGGAAPVQQPAPQKAQPLTNQAQDQSPVAGQDTEPLQLQNLSFDDIYPVFHAYYDTHPLGKVALRNTSTKPITSIKVRFQIKQFMSDPKECPCITELKPGESATVDLLALFLPSILETTEKTKAQARVDVEYKIDGRAEQQSLVQSIPVLDRNATSWTDNRRAAAFVTSKDPAVLTFSKNVNSIVKGKIQAAVNPNFLMGIAFFQALQLFGLAYSADPIPTQTASAQVADYIQFPRQTLQYKGGKCSDFSVLYAALLESIGIETAFVTIPGHIFIAFSTGLSEDDARKSFSRWDDMIFRSHLGWIPLEVTENADFLQAWQHGAKEWRENLSRGQAEFYPLHEAWQLYEPVALPGAESVVTIPSADKVLESYVRETSKFVDQDILPQVATLQGRISKDRDPRKPTNQLAVLYAKYGQYDRAKQILEKLVQKEDYVPALLNLGNILFLSGQNEKALDYYNRAHAKDPDDPKALLAVARADHALENYFGASKAYEALKAKDPDLAAQFSYLDLRGEEATRASDAAGLSSMVVWEE